MNVNICGIEFKNPVITASGTFGFGSEYNEFYDVYSAGTNPGKINPYAIKVMANRGIDISMNRSKGLNEFKNKEFYYVITVCDEEGDACPFFPGGRNYIHKSFPDPTIINDNDETKIKYFTQIRNQIEEWINKTFNR